MACFKWQLALYQSIENMPKACPYAMAFIFNLPCDGERDFFELEVEVV